MTDVMCDSQERVESMMTPRLRTSGWGAIHMEEKITNLLKQRLGSHNHELCFLAVNSDPDLHSM